MKKILILFWMLHNTVMVMLFAFNADAVNRFSFVNVTPMQEEQYSNQNLINWLMTFNADLLEVKAIKIDAELDNNFNFKALWQQDNDKFTMQDKLNRGWLRAYTPRAELRVGLQRLNFGSATILRPLQWFDKLNPLDILETTDGVQATLGKYYFPNNSTLWAWSILSDGKNKVFELIPTDRHKMDMGGRYQFPLLSGETALTVNHRPVTLPLSLKQTEENRIGLDSRFDTFCGLWLEGSLSSIRGTNIQQNQTRVSGVQAENQTRVSGVQRWSASTTLGVDYTFGIGNGLYTLVETEVNHRGNQFSQLSPQVTTTALMLTYPVGILDNVVYFASLNWEKSTQVHSLIWRRSYDKLLLELSGIYTVRIPSPLKETRQIRLLISYTI